MKQAQEQERMNCQQTTVAATATTSMCINTPIVCKIKQDLCDDMTLHSHAHTRAHRDCIYAGHHQTRIDT